MKRVTVGMALLWAAMIGTPANGLAKDKVDVGKREYEANCAVCHGIKGEGDGPYTGLTEQRALNLTLLAKNNGGVFPLAWVYEVIEGERDVQAHGPRDMPIWGWEYKIELAERYGGIPFDAEFYVRARILALAEYIYRLQQK